MSVQHKQNILSCTSAKAFQSGSFKLCKSGMETENAKIHPDVKQILYNDNTVKTSKDHNFSSTNKSQSWLQPAKIISQNYGQLITGTKGSGW